MAVSEADATRVLVVGGGKWATTLANVLLATAQKPARLGIVSKRNGSGIRAWREARSDAGQIVVFNSLDHALDSGPWSAAIVANMPAEHVSTARRLLGKGIPTLVEKPFAPTFEEAKALIDFSSDRNVALGVGHELVFLDDVTTFAALVANADKYALEMWWHEDLWRHRDGSSRVPDLSVGPVSDYLPHLLSILNTAIDLAKATVESVDISDEGVVSVALATPKTDIRITLSRTGGPRRGLTLRTDSEEFTLDLVPDPPQWSNGHGKNTRVAQKPLQRQLHAFMNAAEHGAPDQASMGALLDIVRLTEDAESLLQTAREEAMQAQLRRGINAPLVPAVLDAVREALIVKLADVGLIASVKDLEGADRWSTYAWKVIARLADDAFVSAADISSQLGMTPEDYTRLSEAISNWAAGQKLIMTAGPARKYWTNTIAPLLYNGVIADVLEGRSRFPFRIGIYPGLSCMFNCTFCGRVDGARYERTTAAPGLLHFKQLIDAAPRNDPYRFYISGGLEPLTNPHIGEIVSYGAEQGFKMSMYTNALMLTPATLKRQEGLWALDVLRVSLYGTNAKMAQDVTRHSESFDRVIDNIVQFLRMREERQSPIRVGINHVLLSHATEAVTDLGNLLADIKRKAGTARGIDFLTLREDYSLQSTRGLSLADRNRMRDALISLIDRTEDGGDLAGLTVDLGYALDPLVEGWPARTLKFASDEMLHPNGYPQVSVVVDVLGDVYMYREAGFLDRKGADRYIIGRLERDGSMLDIVADWVQSGRTISAAPGDTNFLDIFDHVVTQVLNLATRDSAAGLHAHEGPVAAWRRTSSVPIELQTIAHPTLKPQKKPAVRQTQ